MIGYGVMFDNKFLIDLYVLALDKHFELFIPIDEKVGNIVKLLDKSLLTMINDKKFCLLNVYTSTVYNNNDIVRNTDIKNGTKIILM